MTVLHDINPIAIPLPFWPHGIHWYGLMYLLAFGMAWWMGTRRVRAGRLPGVDDNGFGDLLFYGMLGVVLGGRVGYVLFYGFDEFLANPLFLLRINEGGMSFHGGLLGVMVAGRLVVADAGACTSSTRWISSRRWCRPAWASAGSATTSAANSGASSPAATGA